MKILKLFIVFVVVAGVVFSAFYFMGGAGSTGIDADSALVFENLKKKIENKWNGNGAEWSQAEFEKTQSELDANLGSLKPDGYKTLCSIFYGYATTRINEALLAEYAQNDCQDSEIKRLMGEYKNTLLNQAPNIKNTSLANEIDEQNKLYEKAMKFAKKTISRSPKFKRSNLDISSYKNSLDKYCNGIKKEKNDITGNPLYKNIKNIDSIEKRMDELDDLLSQVREDYAIELVKQIKKAYPNPYIPKTIKANDDEIDKYDKVFEEAKESCKELNKIAAVFGNYFNNNSSLIGELKKHSEKLEDDRDALKKKIIDAKKRLKKEKDNSGSNGYGMR